MKSLKIFIFILICAILAVSNSKFATHFQRYNDQAYAKQLLNRQQQFQNKLKDIKQQVSDLDGQISQSQGNSTYQIMKLQQGIADERDSLYSAQSDLNQPFLLKPCQKPNLTEAQSKKLTQQIQTTNASLNSMKVDVQKCQQKTINQCTVSDQLVHQITRTQVYLSVMDDYINGDCMRVPRPIEDETATGLVDLNDRLYKDNLQAPNWIYGNITEEQYRLIVFAQTTKFNTTTCPLQTPFANKINNTCFDCPKSIFSLGERVCTCQNGYRFDLDTNECVSIVPIRPCNQTGTCVSLCPQDKPRWNTVNKICQKCPSDQPVVNRDNNSCQACPADRPLWNQQTYLCQLCPQNSHYIVSSKSCVTCKDIQKYNMTSKKCEPICTPYQTYNKQQGKCYSQQQLNGCKCNQKFSNQTNQCLDVCGDGLQWSTNEQKCVGPQLPNFNDTCKYYQRINKDNNQCENYCDSAVAWYDRINHVCIKIGCSVECRCGQIFDNTTGRCIPKGKQCASGQYYNLTTGQCQIKCQSNTTYNPISKTCLSTVNQSCANDQQFDSQTLKCVKKCLLVNHTVFNTSTLKCDCEQGYTSVNGKCVTIESTCTAQNNFVYNSDTQKCQCVQNYYLDKTKTKCILNPITCNQSLYQVYDTESNQCVCKQGYALNANSNCVSLCIPESNMVYSSLTKSCVCKRDYYLSPDAKYCLHISSKCLPANNMNYNATTKLCQCDSGYFMSADKMNCISRSSQCSPANHQHYNETLQKCVCDVGYDLNANSTCVSQSSKCNQSLHFIYNFDTAKCQCATGYTLSNDGTTCTSPASICLSNLNAYYNVTTSVCECQVGYKQTSRTSTALTCISLCKADQSYNTLTQQCSPYCPPAYYYDFASHSCMSRCQPDYTFNNQTMQCEKTVKKCTLPNQFYNNVTGKCDTCPDGYTLNYATNLCEKKIITCANGQFLNVATNMCESCGTNQQYNPQTKTCQIVNTTCPDGQYINFSSGICQKCVGIYDSSINRCRANCTSDQKYDYKSNSCKSISSTCLSSQYYDSSLKTCVFIPTCLSFQQFDSVSKKCISVNLMTSKSASNLVSSNFTKWSAEYDRNKTADSTLRDCVQPTPFYSWGLKSCVTCPTTHPYYNLDNAKCQDCGNYKYDSSLRKCVAAPLNTTNSTTTDPNLDYSLDRLFMNIL